MESVVTYFRGVLRTSVTVAMRVQANIMAFWTRVLLVINHKNQIIVGRCQGIVRKSSDQQQ